MFRNRPGWKPVPYSLEEKEEMERDARIMREESDDIFQQEEREKIAEWRTSTNKPISMHFDPSDKSIYFKILFERQMFGYFVSSLRRPTEREKAANPELYAILDNGEARMGLTRERYMLLRAKLAE
jgi:hypothetical protein